MIFSSFTGIEQIRYLLLISYQHFVSVWNYPEVKKVLPEALYITLLRDPVNCYESNYVYMGLQNAFRMDINKFAQVKAAANIPRRPTANFR